ncbi:MAG: hypothetical protein KKH70_20765 [Gammaproteobacteria bacterium]|nr:hypothetical protein [Gammaproteobacteria bacterium]MBU2395775.1 hypothetical protein [Gammaproteobacteria bacterium]
MTTYPFMATCNYWREAKYGNGRPSGTTTTYSVGAKIYDIRVEVPNTFKPLRGVSEPSFCTYLSTTSDYTLHLEWVAQDQLSYCSIIYDCINRPSTGTFAKTVRPLAFYIRSNVTTNDKYLYVKGAVCKTFNIKGNTGNEYICTADFSCASLTYQSGVSLVAGATKPAGTYGWFNKAGAVIRKTSGTTASIANIVNNVDVTINHNVTDIWNAGTQYKQNAIAGAWDVTGTVDITLDAGGKTFMDNLYTELTDVAINMGFTRFPILRLRGCKWDGFTADLNTDGQPMKYPAKFTAKFPYYLNPTT